MILLAVSIVEFAAIGNSVDVVDTILSTISMNVWRVRSAFV